MSDDDTATYGWHDFDPESMPDMGTEQGRDTWLALLLKQEVDSDCAKALMVHDEEGNMLMRIVFSDGKEEVFDCKIRRQFEIDPCDPGEPAIDPDEDEMRSN